MEHLFCIAIALATAAFGKIHIQMFTVNDNAMLLLHLAVNIYYPFFHMRKDENPLPCGNVFKTRSTLAEDLRIDVCSKCHPFFSGKQKILDTGGRVDKFNKRFGARKV